MNVLIRCTKNINDRWLSGGAFFFNRPLFARTSRRTYREVFGETRRVQKKSVLRELGAVEYAVNRTASRAQAVKKKAHELAKSINAVEAHWFPSIIQKDYEVWL